MGGLAAARIDGSAQGGNGSRYNRRLPALILGVLLQAVAQFGGFGPEFACAADDFVDAHADGGKAAVEILAHPLEARWKRCVDLLVDIAGGEFAKAAVERVRD